MSLEEHFILDLLDRITSLEKTVAGLSTAVTTEGVIANSIAVETLAVRSSRSLVTRPVNSGGPNESYFIIDLSYSNNWVIDLPAGKDTTIQIGSYDIPITNESIGQHAMVTVFQPDSGELGRVSCQFVSKYNVEGARSVFLGGSLRWADGSSGVAPTRNGAGSTFEFYIVADMPDPGGYPFVYPIGVTVAPNF